LIEEIPTMTIPAAENASTAAQLARIRRTSAFACALGAAALALATVTFIRVARQPRAGTDAQPAATNATQEAPEFLLRDAQGGVRGRWNTTGFSVVDPTGRVRAGISVSVAGAPNLTLFSKDGGVRAVVGLGAEDTPALTLHDNRSRMRVRVAVGSDQAPSLVLFDEQGGVIGRLPAPAPGTKPGKAGARR
jgi:hypothetical protein